LGLLGDAGVQHLDGDAAVDARVLTFVDRAHAALTDEAHDAVLAVDDVARAQHQAMTLKANPRPIACSGAQTPARLRTLNGRKYGRFRWQGVLRSSPVKAWYRAEPWRIRSEEAGRSERFDRSR